MGKTVYEHFSFRRPKGKDYGYFAVAFFWDYNGKPKNLTAQMTRKLKLWDKDAQFVAACQSYENALYAIYKWQGIMRKNGITNVMLVTDDSALAGWIEDIKKSKFYRPWMEKATEQYRVGAPREITMSVGLCEVRDYEKAYKFCKEEYVVNNKKAVEIDKSTGTSALDLGALGVKIKTITDIKKEYEPEISDMKEIDKLDD